jgi:hypothetical protein
VPRLRHEHRLLVTVWRHRLFAYDDANSSLNMACSVEAPSGVERTSRTRPPAPRSTFQSAQLQDARSTATSSWSSARVSGRRRYAAHVVRKLAVIETAQRAGLSLDEVGVLLEAAARPPQRVVAISLLSH